MVTKQGDSLLFVAGTYPGVQGCFLQEVLFFEADAFVQ
jgi:hypothetical protein